MLAPSGDAGDVVFWPRGAVDFCMIMTYPKAVYWCFIFCWVMFRSTFVEETKTDIVNYDDKIMVWW